MTGTFTKHLCTALLGAALLSACSRPVAYFQRAPADYAATSNQQATTTTAQAVTTLDQLPAQASATFDEPDAYVSTDSKLATNKTLSRRMIRAKVLVASTAGTMSQEATNAPQKMNLMQRLIVKKLNKQISKQLAPNHPEKAMINTGKLIGGAVLLIAGLIMLIAGTGTVAFIGLIIGLVGALGVLVGLLGI